MQLIGFSLFTIYYLIYVLCITFHKTYGYRYIIAALTHILWDMVPITTETERALAKLLRVDLV